MKHFNEDMAIGIVSTLVALALVGAIFSSCDKERSTVTLKSSTHTNLIQTNDYTFTGVHFGKSWDELERLGYFHRKPASNLITVTETDGREAAFNVFDIESILPMGGNSTNYYIILKSGTHREVPNEVAHNVIKVWQSKMR